jgi:hypothetical protein
MEDEGSEGDGDGEGEGGGDGPVPELVGALSCYVCKRRYVTTLSCPALLAITCAL